MRYSEIKEETLEEGGVSSGVQNSSELAVLLAFTGAQSLDTIPDSTLADPERIKSAIKKVLPTIKKPLFDKWFQIGLKYKDIISKHNGSLPQKYDWVAGDNAGPVADVVFVNFPISGISVKDEGGITLSNLTPKAVGLDPIRGNDVFYHYAPSEFVSFKTQVFKLVVAAAHAMADEMLVPKVPRYWIRYNSIENNFTISYKDSKKKLQELTLTEAEIFSNLATNVAWHRVFGDWFQENFQAHKKLMKPLVVKVAKEFTEIMSKKLESDKAIKNILQFEKKPYYYANPKDLYYVPAEKDAGDIKLKAIAYDDPDGTGQLFKAKIGNDESDDGAVMDIYIRYRNGLFATNPTASVQNLRDPEFIAWDKL